MHPAQVDEAGGEFRLSQQPIQFGKPLRIKGVIKIQRDELLKGLLHVVSPCASRPWTQRPTALRARERAIWTAVTVVLS